MLTRVIVGQVITDEDARQDAYRWSTSGGNCSEYHRKKLRRLLREAGILAPPTPRFRARKVMREYYDEAITTTTIDGEETSPDLRGVED